METDAVQALEVLGCPSKTAVAAVRRVMEAADGPKELEGIVKAALKAAY